MTAYFTEPMSEEFKKAMEDALKEIDEAGENKAKKKRARVAKHKRKTKSG